MNSNYHIRHLEESDTDLIFNTIEQKIKPAYEDKEYHAIFNTKMYYEALDKLSVRRKLYNYQEEYIALFNDEEKIIAIISLLVEYNRSQSVNINYYWEQDEKEGYLSHILLYINTVLHKIAMKDFRILRISLDSEKIRNRNWKKYLNKYGFEIEYTNGDENVEEYVCYLTDKEI